MTDPDILFSLIREAQEGSEDALRRVITENEGLVKSIARRFLGRGQELDDLMQLGYIGMMKAVKNFDPARGCAFSTYAVPMIAGEIRRFLRDDGLLRVSRRIREQMLLLYRLTEDFAAKNGREPSFSELCRLSGLGEADVLLALGAASPAVSLQEPIGGGEENATVEEFCRDEKADGFVDSLVLDDAVSGLDTGEKALIYLRYYAGLTQSECALRLGTTQVSVSRREKKILEKLRGRLA